MWNRNLHNLSITETFDKNSYSKLYKSLFRFVEIFKRFVQIDISMIECYFSTIAVLLKRSRELQMTLTTLDGVQHLKPVVIQPPRYQRPAVKTSHKTTIKTHHPLVMPL